MVKKLIELSSERRKARDSLFNLFITTRSVVGPASRSVIANWIKTVFEVARIASSPGSIRSAVASYSFGKDGPVEEILTRGN